MRRGLSLESGSSYSQGSTNIGGVSCCDVTQVEVEGHGDKSSDLIPRGIGETGMENNMEHVTRFLCR